jgi:hypothetical protein
VTARRACLRDVNCLGLGLNKLFLRECLFSSRVTSRLRGACDLEPLLLPVYFASCEGAKTGSRATLLFVLFESCLWFVVGCFI